MISMMLLTAATLYVLFARYVVREVYRGTGSKRKKWIAIAIFWLIPFGDVLLGYPVYWYLCHFKAGVKIYRTVDNVEGIYVGKNDYVLLRRDMIPRRDGSPGRYSRYKFVDMYDDEVKKYYRLYPVKTHADPNCMVPGEYKYGTYAAYYKTGRCIAKKEITEEQVSRWGYYNGRRLKDNPPDERFGGILSFEKEYIVTVVDRSNNSILAEGVDYWWDGGWLYCLLSSFSPGKGVYCHKFYDVYDISYNVLKPMRN